MDGANDAIRFGTDGWRGVIADEFTFPNLRRVAAAAARMVQESPKNSRRVLIGYDGRFLSPRFAQTVAEVLHREGIEVAVVTSPLPTPALSVSVVDQKADWGFMITASHNPAVYNGFKIKDNNGRSAPPEVTRSIEKNIEPNHTPHPERGEGNFLSLFSKKNPLAPHRGESVGVRGTEPFSFDFMPAYERYIRKRLDWSVLRKLRGNVVFDYLHGVASGIPAKLLKGLPLTLVPLHEGTDPLFGGLHPEPIEPYIDGLKTEVKRSKAIVGIALDGDADRLGVVDERGVFLTPHQVFPLLVLHGIEHKGWRGKIVQAVSMGYLSERIAAAYNLPMEEVPVGFKHIAERMVREDVLAGGEESGGYAVRGGLPERDGILNGLLFLEMIAARGRKPSQLLADVEKRFGKARFKRVDLKLSAPIADREAFAQRLQNGLPGRLIGQAVKEVRTRDGVKIILANGAWVLLRPSGTEPLLRTYAETESWDKTEQLLNWAKKVSTNEVR